MRFREHRGSLADSMMTVRTITGRADLLAHCRTFVPTASAADLTVSLYVPDERIGWTETYVVTLAGYGVVGFTDGPLPVDSANAGEIERTR